MGEKAISPVIASIILIAVTIAIGVAIAGFTFGLFGAYSQTPTLRVESSQLFTNGTLAIEARNVGPGKIGVSSIKGGSLTVADVAPIEILANSVETITADVTPVSEIHPGTAYTFVLQTGDGNTYTIVVIGG